MPDAMAGESVGYHSFVPRWRRNMTHRINHLALFHSGNTSLLSGDFRIKVLKRLKVFHGEMNHEAVAARANSCPSAPIRLEFNHFDDRFSGRLFSTLPHQLPPRRNGGPSGRLYP